MNIYLRQIPFALFSTFLLVALPALAEDMCAGGSPVPVRSSPGGSQTAQLFPYGCVKTGETRDIWVKVSVEGWVDGAELKKKGGVQAGVVGVPGVPAVAPIELVNSTFQLGNRDLQGKASRVQLTLTVKNTGDKNVSDWSGLVAAQDQSGRVLFRSRVSDSSKTIPPGGTSDVSYYWDQSEEPYEALSTHKPGDLKITLHKVEVTR